MTDECFPGVCVVKGRQRGALRMRLPRRRPRPPAARTVAAAPSRRHGLCVARLGVVVLPYGRSVHLSLDGDGLGAEIWDFVLFCRIKLLHGAEADSDDQFKAYIEIPIPRAPRAHICCQ